jgi:hypothetical protein
MLVNHGARDLVFCLRFAWSWRWERCGQLVASRVVLCLRLGPRSVSQTRSFNRACT